MFKTTSTQEQDFKNVRNKRRKINYRKDAGRELYDKAREKIKDSLEKQKKRKVTEREVNKKLRDIMNIDQRRLTKFSNGHTRWAYNIGEVAHLVIIACESYIDASYYMWRTGNPIEDSADEVLRLLDDIIYMLMEPKYLVLSPSERIDIANEFFKTNGYITLQDLYLVEEDK